MSYAYAARGHIPLLTPFSMLFPHSTLLKTRVLVVGAIMSPGKWTVTPALRVIGLRDARSLPR